MRRRGRVDPLWTGTGLRDGTGREETAWKREETAWKMREIKMVTRRRRGIGDLLSRFAAIYLVFGGFATPGVRAMNNTRVVELGENGLRQRRMDTGSVKFTLGSTNSKIDQGMDQPYFLVLTLKQRNNQRYCKIENVTFIRVLISQKCKYPNESL